MEEKISLVLQDKRPPVGVATSRVGVAPSNKVGVVYFSKEEERQLMEGVRRFGRRWRHILSAYQFHHSRTSVNLKDKYRYIYITMTPCSFSIT